MQKGALRVGCSAMVLAGCLLLWAAGNSKADAQISDGWAAIDQRDYVAAYRIFYPQAVNGNPVAQRVVGFLYEFGHGIDRDPAEAARWYLRAASQGDAWGQNNLGSLFEKGLGVTQDLQKARQWYAMAAAQDNPRALENLQRLEGRVPAGAVTATTPAASTPLSEPTAISNPGITEPLSSQDASSPTSSRGPAPSSGNATPAPAPKVELAFITRRPSIPILPGQSVPAIVPTTSHPLEAPLDTPPPAAADTLPSHPQPAPIAPSAMMSGLTTLPQATLHTLSPEPPASSHSAARLEPEVRDLTANPDNVPPAADFIPLSFPLPFKPQPPAEFLTESAPLENPPDNNPLPTQEPVVSVSVPAPELSDTDPIDTTQTEPGVATPPSLTSSANGAINPNAVTEREISRAGSQAASIAPLATLAESQDPRVQPSHPAASLDTAFPDLAESWQAAFLLPSDLQRFTQTPPPPQRTDIEPQGGDPAISQSPLGPTIASVATLTTPNESAISVGAPPQGMPATPAEDAAGPSLAPELNAQIEAGDEIVPDRFWQLKLVGEAGIQMAQSLAEWVVPAHLLPEPPALDQYTPPEGPTPYDSISSPDSSNSDPAFIPPAEESEASEEAETPQLSPHTDNNADAVPPVPADEPPAAGASASAKEAAADPLRTETVGLPAPTLATDRSLPGPASTAGAAAEQEAADAMPSDTPPAPEEEAAVSTSDMEEATIIDYVTATRFLSSPAEETIGTTQETMEGVISLAALPQPETPQAPRIELTDGFLLSKDDRTHIQKSLRTLGLYNGPLDGQESYALESAIRNYQLSIEEAATGELTLLQLARLREDAKSQRLQIRLQPAEENIQLTEEELSALYAQIPEAVGVEKIEDAYRVIERARVRATPDIAGKVLAILKPGDEVRVIARLKGSEFFQVSLPDIGVGYVPSDDLSLVSQTGRTQLP